MFETIYEEINELLSSKNYDIRKSHNARFIDQKCTPDVISFISDCILNLSIETNKTFTFNDIFENQYFIKHTQMIFNKPAPTNEHTSNEYDKFINQPLRMLDYAGVLSSTKIGLKYVYKVEKPEILEFLALRDKNAYEFLILYLKKLLEDSGLWKIFDNFLRIPTKDNFTLLKSSYEKFIIGNTPINQSTEVRRIFTKILNPLSVSKFTLGTKSGNLSKFNINYSDLMYNQINFRDINKTKNITREEAESEKKQSTDYNVFLVQKAKAFIKKLHLNSEVKDKLFGKTTHIHHIFPKSEFPHISDFLENLIALTAGQHLQLAHPNGKTSIIDKTYQCVCLNSKLKSIKESKSLFYRKENFITVLNTGFKYNDEFLISFVVTYNELENEIAKYYKMA